MGHVLLSSLSTKELDAVLKIPSQSPVVPRVRPSRKEIDAALAEVRTRGWALSDERLSFGIRSIAAPVSDGSGSVIAAVNVTTNAAETSIAELKKSHLPLLLDTAKAISEDFSRMSALPTTNPLPK
jgi:IclR family pca regulon transcriptional regulator